MPAVHEDPDLRYLQHTPPGARLFDFGAGPGIDTRFFAEHCRDLIDSGRTVGMLQLQQLRNWNTCAAAIGLFAVRRGSQCCLRWPYRPWNRWLQDRRMRANTDPNSFFMPAEAVRQQMIFYICPRPVVLADVPARDFATAHKLGIHHKNAKGEWDHLPCPAIALRVREFTIMDFKTIGSHTFFVARLASEQSSDHAAQFFRASGIYQHFRKRRGRLFAAASNR